MTDGAAIFGDRPKNVICDDCGYPMALVRTDGDKIGALPEVDDFCIIEGDER